MFGSLSRYPTGLILFALALFLGRWSGRASSAGGFAATTRAVGHARPVTVWELADRTAAYQWLTAHPDLPDTTPDESGGDGLLF